MDTVARRVAAFSRDERLFRRANRVLVAVSGGADSVAALLLMLELRGTLGFEVIAAHFDHQLRPESHADLVRVREICASLSVQCLTGEGDVAQAARDAGNGIEATARRMRYQFLGFVAGEKRVDRIVTGHTADDQAETVLQRVIRGSGVRGIRGMLPLSPVPGSPSQVLARPLLTVTRAETEAVCRAANIAPIVDASNADPRYTRNRIRHETLPALRAVNPSVADALAGLANSARQVFDAVERQAMLAQPIERGPSETIFALDSLSSLPAEALMLVVEREASFHKLTFEVNRTTVTNARRVLSTGAGRAAFGHVELRASCGRVRIGSASNRADAFEPRILNVPGVTIAGGWRFQVSTDEMMTGPGDVVAVIDTAQVRGVLRVRALAPGDRIAYHGRTRRVADVFADHRVPAWKREGLFVVSGGGDGPVAVLAMPAGILPEPSGDDLLYVRASPPQPS